jgi:hypothetical protein
MRGSTWVFGVVQFLIGSVVASAGAQSASPQPAPPPPVATFETAPAQAPSPAAAASGVPAASAPAARSQPTRTANVTFHADDPEAVLQTDWSADGKSVDWYQLCTGECIQRVNAEARFRVAGSGMYESMPFKLPPDREQVTVDAEMKSRSVAVPILMAVAGYTLFVFVGPTLLAMSLSETSDYHGDDGLLAAGIVTTSVGAVVGSVGLVMLIVKAQKKESIVRLANGTPPKLKLPGGMALETRGITF